MWLHEQKVFQQKVLSLNALDKQQIKLFFLILLSANAIQK